MANFIASKASPGIAVMVVVIFQTVHAFIFFLFEDTILGDMTSFSAPEAFNQSLFFLHIVDDVKIS
jgi:hypothetical protein